ncbi:MAG TPA: methyltransferase domain-containing protein [Solirubrobacteraceae bacterium]|nr:methyltransferase domain-containing protein [Solirubrobacteraceae bacterium]
MSSTDVGALGLTEPLRRFVSEMPWERAPILDFVRRAARELEPGVAVADVGAGDAPYRELFSHTAYRTIDWDASPHEGARGSDLIASADTIPVADESFDAVLLTQVLEHVPEPRAVLGELHRVLRAGGRLFLTAPLVWELHELPYDYYRYTASGLGHLLEQAGFEKIEIEARNDAFTTLAQLMRNVSQTIGRDPQDGLDARREAVAEVLHELAEQLAPLAPLDVGRVLPLGFSAAARRRG